MNGKKTTGVDFNSLKVAIVHDWLVGYYGAERVMEQMLNTFPQSDLYALIDFLPKNQRDFIQNKKVTTSFLQKFPRAKKKYRSYLPLMPLAIEQFDMSAYDLIISSNYAVAKGVITGPDQLHICMCYSPIRYAWDLMHQYLDESGLTRGIKGWMARTVLHRIRIWDYRTAAGVDEFIAISNYIARRIKKVYQRDSTVIYPPVDTDRYSLEEAKEDYYLTASRIVPYKRIGMIVDAFNRLPDKRLYVIGDGPEYNKIKAKAGPNVTLLGYQDSDHLQKYLQKARAFVFAACEDFGIVPVEAQACGTPVIAYGKGGAQETVIEGLTGLFFYEQSPDSIADAIRQFEEIRANFDPQTIRTHALRFSISRFKNEFERFMRRNLETHLGLHPPRQVRKLHLRRPADIKNRIPGEDILKNI